MNRPITAPAPPGIPAGRAVGGPVAAATLASLATYVAWSLTVPPFDAAWQVALDEFVPFVLRAGIAALALLLARHASATPTVARAWRLLGWSFAIAAAASGARIALAAGVILPVWVRIGFAFPQVALMLAGLWTLTRIRQQPGRAADWFDAGIVVVAGFLLASHFLVGGNPFDSTLLGPTRWLFLTYLVADVTAVQFVATAWFRRPPGVSRIALALITLGFAVIAISDLRIDQMLQRGTFTNGGPLDAAIALGFALILLGLDAQRRRGAVVVGERPELRAGRHIVGPAGVVAAMIPLVQEAWHPAHDPREIAFLVTGMAVLLVLVLARQVLALRRSEELGRLRAAADARFRSLVQRSSDAILQLGTDQRIQWASPSAGELAGTIPSLLEGRPIADLAHPEDRDRLAAFLANAGEPFARNAALRWRMGRAERWHDVESVVSDLLAEGSTRALVLNTRNISERVRLEQQLRQAQKLEAVGRLAGGIAHDFNNILAAIITHAQLLRDGLPAGDERGADLQEIEQTAQRGAALTRRLLSFSRPEAGELRTQSLTAVLRGMEPMLRRLLVGQVELSLDLGADPLWVRTAEGQVEQILMNLAINARDAMPAGGVVRVTARALTIRPGAGPQPGLPGVLPGRWVELAVRDDGVGMDAETLANLFEPFFTTKPSGLGTGLGLTTVRGIVRALGGHAFAQSTPGAGTTMRVLLPLAPAESAEAPVAEVAVAPPPRGRSRILIVDDELSLRRGMERYLQRYGYETFTAGSALEALELLDGARWEVDLVVTDMVMPRMGGREFVRKLRERRPDLPVLCMSGHMEWESDAADTADAPWAPDRLLAKPFAFEDLLARVRAMLAGAVPA